MSEQKSRSAVDDALNVDIESEDAPQDTPNGTAPISAKRRRRRWPIFVGVLAAVLIAAGAGFMVWHEQPSFCNAICHTPMDPHGATYDQVVGQPGVDKWGNTVEDAGDLMVVSHKEYAGMTCMSCHVPALNEQVAEGFTWVSGNYYYPLEERSLADLNGYDQHETEEGFCLNENCHNMTRDDLVQVTSGMVRNVHAGHDQWACSDCHKAHRQSVNMCSQCHADAYIPSGWLTAQESQKLEAAGMVSEAAA